MNSPGLKPSRLKEEGRTAFSKILLELDRWLWLVRLAAHVDRRVSQPRGLNCGAALMREGGNLDDCVRGFVRPFVVISTHSIELLIEAHSHG